MCAVKFLVCFALANFAVIGSGKTATENDEGYFLHTNSSQKKEIAQPKHSSKVIVIIDTDAGADDAVAILNLLGEEYLSQSVEIRLITTVNGNTNVENVAINVLKILKTAERLDIPVHKGASQSLLRTPEMDDYFGEDGFGDFDFPNPPSKDIVKNQHAVNALIEAVALQPGELTLLCLGPLTNIALATRLDDKFFNKLKEIYVLGGSDSGVGNIKPGVEFNFHMDPEAASIVLKEAEKANKIINIITWETAFSRSTIKMEWRTQVLGVVDSPQVNLLNKAENLTLVGTNWITSDTLLSSVIIDRKIVESSGVYHAEVEVGGSISRGTLYVDYGHSTNSTKNIRIVKKINTETIKRMLLRNLNPWVFEKTVQRK